MYFLSNFCRVCVTSGEKLLPIDTRDYDSISYSVKLKTCTRMVLEMDSWSSFICEQCILKLRISYEFNSMCHKSTKILKNYLGEILSCENEIKNPEADLRISLMKMPQQVRTQRKYVTKGIRCSLLKELLTKIEDDKKKERRKIENLNNGLRPLLNFTKFYNYGYKLEEDQIESIKYDPTPLDKLTNFVHSYFRINFNFRDKITAVLDDSEQWSEENCFEEMLKPCIEPIKFEEVVIEPDISIKKEIFDEEYEDYEINYPVAHENIKVETDIENLSQHYLGHYDHSIPCSSTMVKQEHYPPLGNQSSLDLLKEFTVKFKKHRGFSSNHQRCRTRNHPFINPELKNQFLNQDFSCTVCNRRFKSHGYLHAHRSKMKHW